MSHSWKNSNNKNSVIKANKIFTTRLKSKNNIISVDVSTIDISLDDNITINKIKSLTSDSVETNTIKANTIDLRNYDTSFIVFTNSIFTKNSAGFFELSGQDLSSTNLLSDNTKVNIIESDNSINFTGDVSFNNYVYVDNIDLSLIEQNNNIVVNTNVLINKRLTASEISTNNIITDNSSILINSNIDVSDKIITSDISINQYLNTHTLKVNDICSNYNKIVINNDLSFHSNLFISDLSAYNICGLDSSLIIVNNELSFNNLLTIGSDISDYDNIQQIDNCYNIVGNFNFSSDKNVTTDVVEVDKITPKDDASAIVFDGDLSINGAVYAKFKYNYAANVVFTNDDFNNEINNLKHGGLLLFYPEEKYTDSSLEIFDPNQGNNTSDVRDISLQKSLTVVDNNTLNKVRLYIRLYTGSIKLVDTINDPPVWKKITVRNEISQYYDVVDEISYAKYNSGPSYDCWDLSENNDISENFDVSSSKIIGLKNGVINDDSYNRVYYFDLSAVDPEQFDVSYLLATKHDGNTSNVTDFSDIKLVKYHNDYSNTRVEITMPIVDNVDLSFNLAAHDRLNYVIKSLYINVDGLVEPVEPSWNAIQLKEYDICGTYGHQRYIDQSWSDICDNNPIKNADMTDASAFFFDVSLYRFFGANQDRLHYNLDLSAVHNTDLDLSFNISHTAIGSPGDGSINTLENSDIISLSGNKIIFNSNIEDICNNNNNNNIIDNFNLLNGLDDVSFRDISINVLVHNYYQHGGGDASFDFSAANQDILPGNTSFEIPGQYANDPVSYSTDVSRTIVLNICDIVTNQPPNWKEISEIGISYEGSTDFDISFYTDFSFNNQFYDISASREHLYQTSSSYETSYIYYIWDTSTITDFSRLQYRIDLSALDPEGFTVDYSYVYNGPDYDVSIDGNELFITTPGRRDKDISDLSLVIWPTDNGTLPDASYYDICKNLIFHPFLYKFTEFTFRNCNVVGREGPSKNKCLEYYNANNLSLIRWWNDISYFDMSLDSGIQIWTVPATGIYDITIAGAGGGRSYGSETKTEGFGIQFDTSAKLIKGDKYRILVGQRGNLGNDKQNDDGFNSTNGNKLPYSSSGGGATFLVKDDITLDTLDFNVDISHLVIAVAGGGSGGRTWDTDDVSHTVTDASTVNPSPGANTVDGAEEDRDILDDPFGQAAIGRGIEVNTINGIDISAQGGGSGGGIALDGDLAGTNSTANSFKAQSFRNGGKGGLNNFVNVPTAIGDAKEGGFGGGAAGGDGGSGGGGGYIGGGGDMKAKVDIDVDNKSYAGGGGSYVNDIKHSMKITNDVSNHNPTYDSHGFLTIKFNPYNK